MHLHKFMKNKYNSLKYFKMFAEVCTMQNGLKKLEDNIKTFGRNLLNYLPYVTDLDLAYSE